MKKIIIDENTEIIIQRNWLEILLKYAQRTKKLAENQSENNLKIALPELIGFASSAETILNLTPKI